MLIDAYTAFEYIALMITLIYASWRDHRCRRISHRTWIPVIIISLPHLIIIAPSFGWEVWGVTALLCAGIYVMPILFAANTVFTIHGADAVAAILITLTKPLTLGFPTPVFLILIAGSLILIAETIPRIKKRWNERGIPGIIPLTIAAACIIGLP